MNQAQMTQQDAEELLKSLAGKDVGVLTPQTYDPPDVIPLKNMVSDLWGFSKDVYRLCEKIIQGVSQRGSGENVSSLVFEIMKPFKEKKAVPAIAKHVVFNISNVLAELKKSFGIELPQYLNQYVEIIRGMADPLMRGVPIRTASITKRLDKLADHLESRGFLKEASELDVIANTLEASPSALWERAV